MGEPANERGGWWRRGLRRVFDLLKETGLAWWHDKASRLAAAMAYYTIFSIAPLLVIIIAIIGMVFGEQVARDEIAHQLQNLVGPEATMLIQTMLANFKHPASGIVTSLVGLGTMLYGATGLFNCVQGVLNAIWHAPPRQGSGFRHFFHRRFLHLVTLLGVGAVLLLSLLAEIIITAITQYFHLQNLPQMRNFIVSLGTLTVLFAIIYKILPEVKIAWRDVIIGAAVTSLLFSVGRYLIGAYMRWSDIGSVFGAAGALVILLVWIYYSAQIFLLGAEFTHIYAQKFGSLTKASPSPAEATVSPSEAPPVETAVSSRPLPLEPETSALPDTPALTASPRMQRRAFPKKALAITTLVGTVVASALGANWWYRKRKGKSDS